jgi:hypothetical protein
MRSHHRLLVAIALASLVLAACTSPSASPTDDATPPPAPSGTPVPSIVDGSDSPAPTAEPVPSDELGPFTCDLPIHVDPTTARALVTDVRVGVHEEFDRVVFEFQDGLPEAFLERAEPPFVQDGSGFPVDVEGESFLRLIMRGGTKQTEEGTSSYDGPTDFAVDQHMLVHLIEGGDFEAQSTWYFGLTEEECVRVLTLTDDGSARLVIDIEH